jgi:6-phosphogluconolactonase
MASAMKNPTRRQFLKTASATITAFAAPGILRAAGTSPTRIRVFVGSHAPDGILAYDWDPEAAKLIPAGVAAKVENVAWLAFSHGHDFVYSASELNTFNGKPTGEVASFRLAKDGTLQQLSARNSAGTGTCHVAVDATGQMLLAADYTGASEASFRIEDGKLSEAVWTEHYTEHGPNPVRQPIAHAHFASFSPDNRFAYINDLGGDSIHIYKPEPATAGMAHLSEYRGAPGSGPRTLHFHPNGRTAYSMNELVSTVDVLDWHKNDGSLKLVTTVKLLPPDSTGASTGISTGCDTVISRDGRFVYFANRGDNFLYAFKADFATGKLTPMKRSNCGGKTPRNFTLDPTERWMLVANQDSNLISVFARDPKTGELADEVKSSVAAEAPMRILFV